MTTVEEVSNRVSRLEAAYEHLATKADLQSAKADIIKWVAVSQLIGLGAVAGVVASIVTLIG